MSCRPSLQSSSLTASPMYSDGSHMAMSFDLDEYIEFGCVHMEKGIS